MNALNRLPPNQVNDGLDVPFSLKLHNVCEIYQRLSLEQQARLFPTCCVRLESMVIPGEGGIMATPAVQNW